MAALLEQGVGAHVGRIPIGVHGMAGLNPVVLVEEGILFGASAHILAQLDGRHAQNGNALLEFRRQMKMLAKGEIRPLIHLHEQTPCQRTKRPRPHRKSDRPINPSLLAPKKPRRMTPPL